jgi:hypothetical protein
MRPRMGVFATGLPGPRLLAPSRWRLGEQGVTLGLHRD